ncbi:hypothetical protein RHGRI_030358 [Rhododendron griersonianum]|uniref:Receptor ligand binding region domain-containing protein n=1 Tax=Rhododendron griersonianum TaxID=479676 RepID=A0AAV6IRS6_9ERIC|nr:hypothetical protein RHGRI_030358 [Rhododendron griersonianum]
MKMSSSGGDPIEPGISSSTWWTVANRRKVQSLWIRALYVDWEWAKLGRSEAHLKVWRAWVAVFCSNMRWAMWSWVGTGVVEMGFDWKGRLISLKLNQFDKSLSIFHSGIVGHDSRNELVSSVLFTSKFEGSDSGSIIRQFAMNLMWVLVLILLVFSNGHFSNGVSTNSSNRPAEVNIGSLFTFNSAIGKVAKVAIEAAIEDVNSNPAILGGTKLNITMHDANFSGFLAMAEGKHFHHVEYLCYMEFLKCLKNQRRTLALKFMESDTVAIIGPQSSVTAHAITHIANELQVPLLSFAATDPTLSSIQYPFFVRTTQNDQFQMAAIADIVEYYEWRDVIAIYADDDFGRNGIAALSDELAGKRCQISYKAPLDPQATRTEIMDVLVKVALAESRILVLHTYPTWGLDVLSVAHYLGMMDSGYVWIATNWLTTVLDTDSPLSLESMDNIQGLITLRMYTPESELKRNFVSRWKNLTTHQMVNGPFGLNTYGLYAYDTVWLLAHAIDAFFNQGGSISFSNDSRLSELNGGNLHLDALNIFDGGKLLLNNILNVNLTGLTGNVRFSSDRSLFRPAFEVINVIGTGVRTIGYWSNYSGLSVLPPETLYSKPPNRSSSSQNLYPVIWPGQATQKPRGWVFPNNGRVLRIGVPNRVIYREFIAEVPGTEMFKGYCIDVFTAAVNLLPYALPYKLIAFGDGVNNPSCTELVRLVTAGVSMSFNILIDLLRLCFDHRSVEVFTKGKENIWKTNNVNLASFKFSSFFSLYLFLSLPISISKGS